MTITQPPAAALDPDFERTPPHSIPAEMSVLGAAMLSADAAATVLERLTARDFYRPAHQLVYEAIAALAARGEPVELASVFEEMQRRETLGRAGGGPGLHTLAASVHTPASVGHHVAVVREHAVARGLIEAGSGIAAMGYRADGDLDERVTRAQRLLDEATRVSSSAPLPPVAELIYPFLDRLESADDDRGVTTGWVDLDRLLVRMVPGQLILVAGRPSIGKSVALINMAVHVALKLGRPTLLASLEMSTDEVLQRMVAQLAKVPLTALRERRLSDADWDRVTKASAELGAAEDLFVDGNPDAKVSHLRSRLTTMRRSGRPAAAVFLDYVQLMAGSKKAENRQVELSEVSRALKLLAKEFEVPIVSGAQLNRGPEQRADHRPVKADLRESGSLENDADVVILLHREDAYDPQSPRRGEIELIVDKNRQGPKGVVTCAFQGQYARIADMAPREWSLTAGLS